MTPSQKPQDGGAAFPLHPGIAPDWTASTGMTLRDYIAAKVLAAITVHGTSKTWAEDAKGAYAAADAMLAAREAQP